jgi:hypothetical protein
MVYGPHIRDVAKCFYCKNYIAHDQWTTHWVNGIRYQVCPFCVDERELAQVCMRCCGVYAVADKQCGCRA